MLQREFPLSPLVGVGAVVFDELGRVLVIRRGAEPLKGRWSLPGGLLEVGEKLVDGVVREVREETGLEVQPEAILEVVDRIHEEDGRVRYHYVVIDYWCRVVGGELKPESDAAEAVWAAREDWHLYALEAIALQVIEKGWLMASLRG
jgi:8-oxo-dGTP diphosphatase